MTSLGRDAKVGTITCKVLNAKTLNPPLAGVLNPLGADLSLGNNDILDCENIGCSQLNFTTLNGLPIAAGTLANPLLAALDGNGNSFEGIGVGGCATLTTTGAITCKGIDATSGTFTTNTLTTSGDGLIKGTTTATGLTTTNQNSIVKEVGSTVNGNKTINSTMNAKDITATGLTNSGDSIFKDLTTTGLLTCTAVNDSGALFNQDLTITGNFTLAGNAFIAPNQATLGKLTAGKLKMPVIANLGTEAVPLDLTGIAAPGVLNLGGGGKGVVYAWTTNPGSTYPVIFTVQTTATNPLRFGNLIVQSQLYQHAAVLPYAELVSYEILNLTLNTFRVSCFYDNPTSALTTHRVSVIYIPDEAP